MRTHTSRKYRLADRLAQCLTQVDWAFLVSRQSEPPESATVTALCARIHHEVDISANCRAQLLASRHQPNAFNFSDCFLKYAGGCVMKVFRS